MLLTLFGAGAPPASVPGITFIWLKDAGTWRLCTAYLNQNGTFGFAQPYIKVSGNWK